MRWSDLLRMSASSLKRRKLRTFLTVLGVVIGTASIVVMISLGLGLQQSMYEEVEQSGGTTSLTVTGQQGYGMGSMYIGMSGMEEEESEKYITDDVIEDLRALEHVKSAEPVINIQALGLKGNYEGYLDIYGMSPTALEDMNLELEPGGRLPDPDSPELELLYGNAIIMNFYDKNSGKGYWDGEIPDIDLQNDKIFLVLDQDAYYQSQYTDVMANSGTGESGGTDGSTAGPKIAKKYVVQACGVIAGGAETYNANSYSVFCDITRLKEYLEKEFRGRAIPGQPTTKSGKPYSKFVYTSAKLQADDMDNVEELSNTIRSMGYNVSSNIEYINAMKSQFAMVQAVLGGIGAVSLLVAAIGIANTMLMSIYERTKEIGVMKVIGCSLKNIGEMFLLEAAFIGLAGGLIGNILSLLMSAGINAVVSGSGMVSGGAGISYIPPWLMLLSMGFAVLVGMTAGFFPAMRAMKLSPLAAIRSE